VTRPHACVRRLFGRLLAGGRNSPLWPRRAGGRLPGLVVPVGLEDCGWGLIDWRGLPDRVAVGLLRAADRIAREGHAVAFTGHEYQAGPELEVDGQLTVTRYLSGHPGWAPSPAAVRDLITAALTGAGGGATRVALVCHQPELSKEDAGQVIASLQRTGGPARGGGVDVYGYDWTLHA
jgi:hypothetical protein